jgi:hypothetical protein
MVQRVNETLESSDDIENEVLHDERLSPVGTYITE